MGMQRRSQAMHLGASLHEKYSSSLPQTKLIEGLAATGSSSSLAAETSNSLEPFLNPAL